MRRRGKLTLLCVVAVLALAGVAYAAYPQDAPNDPGYDSAEGTPDKCLTEGANEEQYYLFSFMPQCTQLTARDPENASGMSVDRAWREFTTGRSDTVIAYIEAGINWHGKNIEELANRVFLNKGELPAPTTDNRDGTLNAADYADTPDHNKNETVDPEDIIVRFQNGRDEDGNGYTDDISGWDFYHDQNDPATVDSGYEHANNQEKQAAAETNNGVEEAGVCPDCMILPIKGGAEALDRTNELAEAWMYAADMKADVLVSVTADLGYSSFMREAVEYVWDRDVVMVEASNDFNSTDHQGGMFWPHVLPGNGMVANSRGVEGPAGNALTTTYRSRSNLTSWGTKNMFTAATKGGTTSEATPTVGGVLALVRAYSKKARDERKISSPLSAGEAIQVVRATSSDVDDPTLPWPGKPGFDLQYGYGRPNVHKAMTAVSRGEIPPVGWIDSPRWYELYDPSRTSRVPVTGHVEARRSKSYRWRLEYAPGAEPADGEFITAGSGSGTKPMDRSLGSLDLSRIPRSFWTSKFGLSKTKELETNEQYTVTMRLRVTDAEGRMGEERRSIAVHHDPDLKRPTPKRIGVSGEAQPMLADLRGQGRLAYVFPDTDGRVHAIDSRNGRELPGWPARARATVVEKGHPGVNPRGEPFVNNVAIGDLDHNGKLSVVATSTTGRVYVFDSRGRSRRGWSKAMLTGVERPGIPRPQLKYTRQPVQGAVSPPVLVDLDGDRKLEIVQAGWNGRLHAWHADGRTVKGWPVHVRLPAGDTGPPGQQTLINDQKLVTAPAVADLDGDRKPELVVRSQYTHVPGPDITPGGVAHLHAYRADGTQVPNFPIEMQGLVEYYGSAQEFITEGSHAPSVADVDGDGNDEVASSPIFTPPSLFDGNGQRITTYGSTPEAAKAFQAVASDPAGVLRNGAPQDVAITFTTSGAFGRFGSGLTYAQPASGTGTTGTSLLLPGSGLPLNNFAAANDARSGSGLPGFPAKIQGLDFLGAPAIADISGDGVGDLIVGGDSSALHGFGQGGGQTGGFPKFMTGWVVWTPTVGDVDSDGRNDVAVATREGYLMAWKTPGRATANDEWWSYRHDEWNTGRYGVDARPPGVARSARYDTRSRRLRFKAPGDDWYAGRAESYRVTFDRGSGARVARTVRVGGAAGASESIVVPRGVRAVKVQAVDDAGNLALPRTVRIAQRGAQQRRPARRAPSFTG